ncbi:MAG: hypothetical protein D6719_07470 [Candidatus Dadabacteria bacterium]|nr:MAG: hypothetical protein D6719_07470 [Candidatus Dadabacteria bacterium]
MVKIGTTQAQRKLFFNLNKEKERLEREGFHAGPKLLAHNLDVKESEIIEMQQRLSSPDISVDAPLSDDGESDLLSILPADDQTAEELVANKEIKTILNKGLKDFSETLNQKEKVIFEKRMLGEEKATLQVLSEELGVSRERVRQIENRIREKLKNYLEERFGPSLSGLMQGG